MFLSVLLLTLQIFCVIGGSVEKPDEVPGFFLKVTKNVPRIGRSSGGEFENFFLKQSKSVPRIGRRNSQDDHHQTTNPFMFFQHPLPFPYKNIIPFDAALIPKISQALRQNEFTFIAWDDLDNALEKDLQLYVKLYDIGKSKEELNYLPQTADEESNPNILTLDSIRNNENSFYRVNRAADGGAPN